jgi:geranylgeranyl pyrophosphate synthase
MDKSAETQHGSRVDIISALRLGPEIEFLEHSIERWIAACSSEMHDTLTWQFSGPAKYFRPATLFSCFSATYGGKFGDRERLSAMAIELIHNMTLIVDDILDNSEYRRKKRTLHAQFGLLPALMTSGFITAEVYRLVREDPEIVARVSELVTRLGVAECFQWRVRAQPLGVEDWRLIATEDTGSMFEICACLGGRGQHLRKFGQLLGILYHGCDDVADVRGLEALGGGGDADIRDSILTLPASIAIRDPDVAAMFQTGSESSCPDLSAAFKAALPEAERVLDGIFDEASEEAIRHSKVPKQLLTLLEYTRNMSRG